MDKKKAICPICQKPILDPDKTEADRILDALETLTTGITRRPYGFCRCKDGTDDKRVQNKALS